MRPVSDAGRNYNPGIRLWAGNRGVTWQVGSHSWCGGGWSWGLGGRGAGAQRAELCLERVLCSEDKGAERLCRGIRVRALGAQRVEGHGPSVEWGLGVRSLCRRRPEGYQLW